MMALQLQRAASSPPVASQLGWLRQQAPGAAPLPAAIARRRPTHPRRVPTLTRASAAGSGVGAGAVRVADTQFYDLLGVPPSASQQELKAAYRQAALRLHPDVNDAPDATEKFAAVASAYDTLSDPASRALYDQYGPEDMKGRAGATAGSGNASRAWDEFKPFEKKSRKRSARAASAASFSASSVDEAGQPQASGSLDTSSSSSSSGGSGGEAADDPWAGMPVAGTVVEYPLPQQVIAELQDGRSHGVGLLVSRNLDRGDAKRLPPEALDLCEVEPLRQEAEGSDRWIPDELSVASFPRLGELRPIAVDGFDRRFDVWTITAPLSEGCGGPELGEEVIV